MSMEYSNKYKAVKIENFRRKNGFTISVYIYVGFVGVYFTRTCYPDVTCKYCIFYCDTRVSFYIHIIFPQTVIVTPQYYLEILLIMLYIRIKAKIVYLYFHIIFPRRDQFINRRII